jgi:drug/metabolite transporter (DMT)-like permease
MTAVVVLALAAAACYGTAAVLQHQAASSQPHLALRADLFWRLVRHPRWLFSNVLDFCGYVFQVWALRTGPLTLVEPLLVVGLVIAFPVSAWLGHRRVSGKETAAAAVVTGGLVLFLAVARPRPGHPQPSDLGLVLLSVVAGLVVGGAWMWARPSDADRRRAGLVMAVGSGIAFGYMAATTSLAWQAIRHGTLHALASWEPYAVLVSAAAGGLLAQGAFNSGKLRLSLPTMTVVQPLVAIAIGLVLFGERIDGRGLAPLWEAVGLAAMTVGVFALASPEFPDQPGAAGAAEGRGGGQAGGTAP